MQSGGHDDWTGAVTMVLMDCPPSSCEILRQVTDACPVYSQTVGRPEQTVAGTIVLASNAFVTCRSVPKGAELQFFDPMKSHPEPESPWPGARYGSGTH